MTTPPPTVSAPPPWDEERFTAVLRAHKPLTPKLRRVLQNYMRCTRACTQAHDEYIFEAQISGAADCSRLRIATRHLVKARREAVIALGENPNTSDLLPQADPIPDDAIPVIVYENGEPAELFPPVPKPRQDA